MGDAELVCCRDLVCGYEGKPVVGPLDLRINRGEVLMLLGGSGSGKSTLLRTLLGLLPAISGELRLLGQDLAALEPARRRSLYRRVGVLFQSDALLGSMTVLDNVVLPLRESTRLPPAVVRRLGLARLALLEVPHIWRSWPTQISGGQAKRAALARATILDPALLFCDEPTSALDPLAAEQIDDLLLRFRDVLGTTIVAATHDVASARAIADRAILLHREGIRAQGTFGELQSHPDPEVRHFFSRGALAHDREAQER